MIKTKTMEATKNYKDHFDRELSFSMNFLETYRKNIINYVVAAKILNILTIIVFLSIFLGFLNAFPFKEFNIGFGIYAIQGFFYLIMSFVITGIVQTFVKYILEMKRKKEILQNTKLVLFISLIISAIMIFSAWLISSLYFGNHAFTINFIFRYVIAFFTMLILGLVTYFLGKFEQKFDQNFKIEAIPKILPFFNSNIKYENLEFINQSFFEESRLFRYQHIYSCDGSDYASGSYGEGEFAFSQLLVREKNIRNFGGKREVDIKTLFKGLFFITDFNKKISGRTLIYPDFARRALGSQFGEMLNHLLEIDETHLVKFDDPDFEKEFAVYSSNQEEARNILSPSMLELIKTMRLKINKNIYMSFINSKLYVAIPSENDILSPIIFNEMTDYYTIEPIYVLIDLLIDLSRNLHLNSKI